jgi:hypothetical protein
MDLAYPTVLKRRHRIQEAAGQGERTRLPGEAPKDGMPEDCLPDPEVEEPAKASASGHRDSWLRNWVGWACFRVFLDTKEETIRGTVAGETAEEACVFTDENRSCMWPENEEESRTRNAIDHSEEWAADQDGDDIR